MSEDKQLEEIKAIFEREKEDEIGKLILDYDKLLGVKNKPEKLKEKLELLSIEKLFTGYLIIMKGVVKMEGEIRENYDRETTHEYYINEEEKCYGLVRVFVAVFNEVIGEYFEGLEILNTNNKERWDVFNFLFDYYKFPEYDYMINEMESYLFDKELYYEDITKFLSVLEKITDNEILENFINWFDEILKVEEFHIPEDYYGVYSDRFPIEKMREDETIDRLLLYYKMNLIKFLAREGNKDKALDEFNSIVERIPFENLFNTIGEILIKHGYILEGIEIYEINIRETKGVNYEERLEKLLLDKLISILKTLKLNIESEIYLELKDFIISNFDEIFWNDESKTRIKGILY